MRNIKQKSMAFLCGLSLSILSAGPQASGNVAMPPDPLYVQECGSCHVPYPARMLSRSSWQALLNGLQNHFGSNADLDRDSLQAIGRYLEANAKRGETVADGKPILRITETRWFQHEHDEISGQTWKLPAVKSPSNCAACHMSAAQGNYSEHQIRIPRN